MQGVRIRAVPTVMAAACALAASLTGIAAMAVAQPSSGCALTAVKPYVGTDPRVSGKQVFGTAWFKCEHARKHAVLTVFLQRYWGPPGKPSWQNVGGTRSTFPKVRAGKKRRQLFPAQQACSGTYPYRVLATLKLRGYPRLSAQSGAVTLGCP